MQNPRDLQFNHLDPRSRFRIMNEPNTQLVPQASPHVARVSPYTTQSYSGWTPVQLNLKLFFNVISANSDGSILVGAVYLGDIYRSTDSGVTWTPTGDSNLNTKKWQGLANSSDGSTIVAVVYDGDIYRSTDSGVTWTSSGDFTLIKSWVSVASSSNGQKLVAVVFGGDIYRSTDSGITWTPTDEPNLKTKDWNVVESSSDGSKLVALVYNCNI